jgi:flagellar basal body-associated protein FliL
VEQRSARLPVTEKVAGSNPVSPASLGRDFNFRILPRMKKTILNTLITVTVLIILFLGAGIAYVLVSEKTPVEQPVPAAKTSGEPSALPKPSQPSPNAPEQVAVENLTSPVKPGTNSALTIKTNATSTCTISVTYNGVASKDSGLTPKVADAYGNATWSWTVDASAPAGTWPVKATCVYRGRSAVAIANLQVTK